MLLLGGTASAQGPPASVTFERATLDSLPLAWSPWAAFATIDALTIPDRIDGAGLTTGLVPRVGIRGTSWTQTSYWWNGFDVTRPDGRGVPFVHPDIQAARRVTLMSALLPASWRGPGGLMLSDAGPPARQWTGSATVAFAPASAARRDARAPAIDRVNGLGALTVQARGPALANRLQLSASATRISLDHTERHAAPTSRALTALRLESNARVGAHDDIAVAVGVSDADTDRGAIDGFTRTRAFDVAGRFTRTFAADDTWAFSAIGQRAELDASPTNHDVVVSHDPIREGPLADRLPAAGWSVRSWTVDTTRSWGSRQLGAAVSRSGVAATWWPHPITIAETIDDRAARVWTYTAAGPFSKWTKTELAAFAMGRFSIGALDLDVGARLDATIARGMTSAILSPRIDARWPLTRRLAIRGGYARYAHRLPLTHLAFGDSAAPSADVRVSPAGPFIARLGPGAPRASIDPDLTLPWTDEVVAALQWRRSDAWPIQVTGVRRRDRDLIATVNAGVSSDDFDVRVIPDPAGDLAGTSDDQLLPVFSRRPESFARDREVLTNPDGRHSVFEALELTIERRASRWWLRASASAARTVGPAGDRGFGPLSNDQSVLGDALLTPNGATFDRGRVFFDRAFTIKLAGTARGPRRLALGWIARYQDGQPFSRLVRVDDLTQGPELIRAVPNGRHRFQFLATLDVRLSKSIDVSAGAITIALDAFNLLNHANEVEERVITGPRFREVTAVQPPRTIRLTLRVGF